MCLLPESDAVAEGFGEDLIESSAGFGERRAGAEVCEDDEFVLEAMGTIEEIIEVHVAEFVNFFAAMFGPEEGHFGDEDFAGVDIGVSIEAWGGGIAGEADEGVEEFGGDFGALESEVADLVAGESAEFGSEFFSDIVDDVADGRDGMSGGEDGDAVFA